MKKIALSTFTVLIVSLTYGQNCKFRIDEPDPITGEPHLRHDFLVKSDFVFKTNVFVGLEKKAGKLLVNAVATVVGEEDLIVPSGTSFVIKLENGDTLSAVSTNDAAPVSFILGTNVFTKYEICYDVDQKFMAALASSPPTFIRIRLGSGRQADANIKKGASKKIMKYADCLK